MATAVRTSDPDVEREFLRALVESEPFRFQFFQAVRLLARAAPEKASVGHFAKPDDEGVRFKAHQSTSFPASEIQAIDSPEGKPPRLTVNFMGLTGPLGVLPLYYTEYVRERSRSKDRALEDFLDIFNHRAISLFYRAWEKNRASDETVNGANDSVTHPLLALIGLGTSGLQVRQEVEDDALVYYVGLFAQHPGSARALEHILADYFDVPVHVEQFAGAWFKLDRHSQTCLDQRNTYTEALGLGTVVGDAVWDQQCMVRIKIGPLPLERYLEFLPTGSAWKPLRSLVRLFNDQIDFDLQLILEGGQTPGCELGAETQDAPRLGWLSWIKTAPLGRDPGDTVLKLSK